MRYEAILYFDGPLSKWLGVPDYREVLARKSFRFEAMAIGWARGRIRGLDQCKFVVLPKP
jgi:hypothetical protein